MTTFRILAAALMFALAAPALARDTDLPMAATKAQFEAIKAKLVSQLETDKFSEIKADDKQTVLNVLDRIEWRYDSVASPDQFSAQDRVDMFNDQEIINTIITHAAKDSRLICERHAPTGSHLVRVNCMTLAERKERERNGQDSMNSVERDDNNTFPGATTMRQGITR
jgi:hypothetical protein